MTQTTNKKTLYPSMFRRSLEFNSDNSRQDRGYDRGNHFRYTHFYTFTKNIRIVLQKLKYTKQFAEVAPKQMTLPIEVVVHREYPH